MADIGGATWRGGSAVAAAIGAAVGADSGAAFGACDSEGEGDGDGDDVAAVGFDAAAVLGGSGMLAQPP